MKSLNRLIQTMVGVLLWGLASPLAAAEPRIPNEKPVYHGLLEKQFADIEAKVPGFAGWYFDDDGNAVIRLKDISRERDAMDHLGSLLDTRRQAGRGLAAERKGRPHMKARPAMFSFSELAAFREAIFQVFPDGLYSIDLDERTNVVSLGVRDEEVMRKIHGLASGFHIPAAALHMEITSMAESRYSLTDYQRPLRGGVGFIFNSQSG